VLKRTKLNFVGEARTWFYAPSIVAEVSSALMLLLQLEFELSVGTDNHGNELARSVVANHVGRR
jgi:hypothetical protein